MTSLHIQPLPDSTPDVVQKIDTLNRKLGSFLHAPLNLKEVLRMEPFAADGEVVRAVAATLDDYAILPTSPAECERQRTTGLPKDYDIVGFWYCVALLALSAEPEAVRYLLVLARMLMVEDPAELFLLRRTVRLLDGFPFPHLQELRSRIEAFYDAVTHRLEAFRWLEAAGIPWPESYEWEVITQFSSDGEPYADPAAPKEERCRRVVLTFRLNSPRSLYGSCRQHNSYEISLRNDDNTTRGLWNEGHGDLFIEDRQVMQHRMFTPLHLPELFDALEGFGIRLVRKPVMVYTSQGIRNAHVKVFRMLEDQLGRNPLTIGQPAGETPDQPKEESDADGASAGKSGFPEVGRAVEEALDLFKYDGDVNDSLAEMREKWGKEISALHDTRFDDVGTQYACLPHEEGMAALGQELTCHGYRLYDLDGDDIYLLTLQPEAHAADFEKACRKAGQYCRLLTQPGRAPGTPARETDPGRTMPCEETYRYDNGTLTPLGFHLSSGDGFNGSLPVPETGRLVMCGFSDREPVARLLELDIDTRRCRATRMQNVDPWSNLLPFGDDWVLIKGGCDSMRLDFARLWNRTTGEVLRIRPGMFGSERLEHIGRLSDGRVVLTTLRSHVGQVVHFPADFWNFLRTASRPQTMGPMQPCETLYPDIPPAQPE